VVIAKPLMELLQQPQDVIDLAKPYLYWVAFSLVPLIIYHVYKQFAVGLSLTKYSLYAIVMANVVHVFLIMCSFTEYGFSPSWVPKVRLLAP
jgi:MATE family multidrug resistance protein